MTATSLRFGPWLLLRRLGTGGMAEVWQAVAAADPQAPPVAVKRLLPPLRGDPTGMALFAHEIEILGRLDHPAIPALLASGQDAGLPWLAMPDLGGVDFRALLALHNQARPVAGLDVNKAWCQAVVLLAMDVWAALQAAHLAGVVHCDVSPTNIVVRPDGSVFLVDFGIAALADTPILPGLRGKRPYLAPELWRGHFPSPAADAWALAAVITEALTGQRPEVSDPVSIKAQPPTAGPMATGLSAGRAAEVPGMDAYLWRLLQQLLQVQATERLALLPQLGPALRKVCTGRLAQRARVTLSSCVRQAMSVTPGATEPLAWTVAAEERGEAVTSPLRDPDATQVHELQVNACLDGAPCVG